MFIYFIFFIAGVFTHKVLQFVLSITPSYNIFKESEMVSLKILAEIYLTQQKSLALLKAAYETVEDKEEYALAEKTIKLHYETLINNSLLSIKKNLPYKVPYNTLNEAVTYYIKKVEKKDE